MRLAARRVVGGRPAGSVAEAEMDMDAIGRNGRVDHGGECRPPAGAPSDLAHRHADRNRPIRGLQGRSRQAGHLELAGTVLRQEGLRFETGLAQRADEAGAEPIGLA